MPVLILMRHGKSDWNAPSMADHDRPLATRGERAAARMGRFLTEVGIEPAVVISSTAARAAGTAALTSLSGGWKCKITHDPRLYGGSPQNVIDVVRTLDADVHCALMIGHNPSWAETTSMLVGGCALRFPTAATACLDIDVKWNQLGPGTAVLRWFVTPRLLENTR